VALAHYYADHRGISDANIFTVACTTNDDIFDWDYKKLILKPVKEKVHSLAGIDYVVLTKGVPIRCDGNRCSVDSELAAMDFSTDADKDTPHPVPAANPYFNKAQHFHSHDFGFYLVTRLDGASFDDARRLVDNSMRAKAVKGPFFFDTGSSAGEGGYAEMHRSLISASAVLKSRGFDATTDQTDAFIAPSEPLAGYSSWGSNDQHFDPDAYRRLRFKPGALAETFVSTSARTFDKASGGQSLISDLIANGVTGVKGYVSEPYTAALAKPDILFDRYTKGFNLAESFYMASPALKWKDIVVGDPLCSPYGKS
jgi:uncharacterized protein (TIGR03790 family)